MIQLPHETVHNLRANGAELIAQAVLLLDEAEREFSKADDFLTADKLRRHYQLLRDIYWDTGVGDG